MQTVNQDAHGGKLYYNFGLDISSNTELKIEFQPEVGSGIEEKTPTLETSNVWVGDVVYMANEFVSYTITEDMFQAYTGRWRMKAQATVAAIIYTNGFVDFMVTE